MEGSWKVLVQLLREIAIEKHGSKYQKVLSEKTKFTQSNLSRIFSLKYCPSLDNFIIICKALEVRFFFEDKEDTTDLSILFNRAMDKLGRHDNANRN